MKTRAPKTPRMLQRDRVLKRLAELAAGSGDGHWRREAESTLVKVDEAMQAGDMRRVDAILRPARHLVPPANRSVFIPAGMLLDQFGLDDDRHIDARSDWAADTARWVVVVWEKEEGLLDEDARERLRDFVEQRAIDSIYEHLLRQVADSIEYQVNNGHPRAVDVFDITKGRRVGLRVEVRPSFLQAFVAATGEGVPGGMRGVGAREILDLVNERDVRRNLESDDHWQPETGSWAEWRRAVEGPRRGRQRTRGQRGGSG